MGLSCSSADPRNTCEALSLQKNLQNLLVTNYFLLTAIRGYKRYLSPGPGSRWVKRFTKLALPGEASKVFKA